MAARSFPTSHASIRLRTYFYLLLCMEILSYLLVFYLHPSTIVPPCTAASQKFTAVNSIDLFSYCMLLAACCWLLAAATADCCRLQLAAAGFPSRRVIVSADCHLAGVGPDAYSVRENFLVSSSSYYLYSSTITYPPAITGSSAFKSYSEHQCRSTAGRS